MEWLIVSIVSWESTGCNQMNVPRSIIHRVLRNEDMYPYHFSSVQHLREDDVERRLEFCRWLIFENNRGNTYCSRILFSDESLFTRERLFNAHTMHYWAEENPFVIRERSFQIWSSKWNLNIWAGILGNELIGLCVLPNRIRGNNYADFLKDNLFFGGFTTEYPSNYVVSTRWNIISQQ